MPVNPKDVKAAKYFCTEAGQVRKVISVGEETVTRAIPKRIKRKKMKVKRVKYQARGHQAGMSYGFPYTVDLTKFCRDVEKQVGKDYDPDYDPAKT
jgi:hypothetical protein